MTWLRKESGVRGNVSDAIARDAVLITHNLMAVQWHNVVTTLHARGLATFKQFAEKHCERACRMPSGRRHGWRAHCGEEKLGTIPRQRNLPSAAAVCTRHHVSQRVVVIL